MRANYTTLTLTLVAVSAMSSFYAVNAENAFDSLNGNGGVRGYDVTNTSFPITITNVQALSEPLSPPESQRATLGTPSVLLVVLGCVAAVVLALALAYRARDDAEPTTPRDDDALHDDALASVVSSKSSVAQYQQSFDRPSKLKVASMSSSASRPLEPHSPKMPPPSQSHVINLSQTQPRFAPHSPTHSAPRMAAAQDSENQPVDVVVVAM